MFCFNLRLLIHNCTHLDCSYRMSARELWLTSVSLISPRTFPTRPCRGWSASHSFNGMARFPQLGPGKKREQTPACALTHSQTNRFVRQIWLEVVGLFFFAVFLCTQKTPCEINARQRKHLETAHSFSGTLNCGEASGRWKLLFYFVRCFPFSPSKPL